MQAKNFIPVWNSSQSKPLPGNINEINTDTFTIRMEKFQKILKDNMLIVQTNHKRYANQHRGPTFSVQTKEKHLVKHKKSVCQTPL